MKSLILILGLIFSVISNASNITNNRMTNSEARSFAESSLEIIKGKFVYRGQKY